MFTVSPGSPIIRLIHKTPSLPLMKPIISPLRGSLDWYVTLFITTTLTAGLRDELVLIEGYMEMATCISPIGPARTKLENNI